ncbi:MAG: ABC transporter substrate-binding protein [Nocardioides sp.]
MRRWWTDAAVLLTVAGLVSATLAACGGGHHSPHPSPPHPTDTRFYSPPSSHSGVDPIARGPITLRGATRGGTVTVLTHDGLHGSLDPSAASTRDVTSILSGLVTRSLTQYRYDRASRQMVLTPDISTDLGEHNDHYTKWIFDVRGGVRFQDGTRVTASDVVRGIRRCLRSPASRTRPCLSAPIRSVQVHHHRMVMIKLRSPYPDLPYLVALPAFGPIEKGSRDTGATGPYRVRQFRPGHRLVLVRNPDWDPATDAARTQYPDRYVFRSGLREAQIQRTLRRDRGAAGSTLTYDDMRPAAFSAPDAQDRLVRGPTPCTTYLAVDGRTIADPAVRRALIWAFPYRRVIRAEGLTPGVTAVPATNLEPPGIPGRTAVTVHGHAGFATRPLVARRMLARAQAVGTRVRFSDDPAHRAGVTAEQAMVRSLRTSGFYPEPVPVDSSVDIRIATRCGRWPVGSEWIPPVYRSTGIARYVAGATRHIESLPLDLSGPAWNRLDHAVLRRWQPIVPLWYTGVAMAHGSRIEGMADDTVTGMPTWSHLWVQE